jgi:hypothetical protein
MKRRLLLLCAPLALAGCAAPRLEPLQGPPLRLAPATLDRELVLLQRLDITAAGQTRSLEVALEADATSVRLAFMQLGQTVARIEWDGSQLRQELAPGWPEIVSAAQVLSDLQLVWWPAAALRTGLPPDWSLAESPRMRQLIYRGRPMTSAQALSTDHIQLIQHLGGYVVELRSQGAVPPFASTAGTP